jgi:hypothetical protein
VICYFDSSAILSHLLEEREVPGISRLWDESTERLSSNLLKIECIVGIRRAGLAQGFPADTEWPMERIDLLTQFLSGMSFKIVDESVENIIRLTPGLSNCRALDALHLATALLFRSNVDEPFSLVTLDNRMKALAPQFGFPVLPGA